MIAHLGRKHQLDRKSETKQTVFYWLTWYCCRYLLQKKTPGQFKLPVKNWPASLLYTKLSGNRFKLNDCMFLEAGYGLSRFWQYFRARKGCCKLTEWNQSTPLFTISQKLAPKLHPFAQAMHKSSKGGCYYFPGNTQVFHLAKLQLESGADMRVPYS